MRHLLALVVFAALVPRATRGAAPQNAEAASRERITIKVKNAKGVPLKDDLVIVRNLNDRNRELLRALTNSNGDVPSLDLRPGLYRIIATFPYSSIWETEIQEFLVVKGHAKQIVLEIPAMDGNPCCMGAGIPGLTGPKIQTQVLTADGLPASGASILVRDKIATAYMLVSYQTDAKGIATIELVAAPHHEPTVVVVVYQDVLVKQEVPEYAHSLVIHLPEN
jgi:hypothetical protein